MLHFPPNYFFQQHNATEKSPLNPYNDWIYTDNLSTPNVTLV